MINVIVWSQIEYKLIYIFLSLRIKKSLVGMAGKYCPSFRVLAFRMEEFLNLKQSMWIPFIRQKGVKKNTPCTTKKPKILKLIVIQSVDFPLIISSELQNKSNFSSSCQYKESKSLNVSPTKKQTKPTKQTKDNKLNQFCAVKKAFSFHS